MNGVVQQKHCSDSLTEEAESSSPSQASSSVLRLPVHHTGLTRICSGIDVLCNLTPSYQLLHRHTLPIQFLCEGCDSTQDEGNGSVCKVWISTTSVKIECGSTHLPPSVGCGVETADPSGLTGHPI